MPLKMQSAGQIKSLESLVRQKSTFKVRFVTKIAIEIEAMNDQATV